MSRKMGHLVLVVGPSGAGKDSVITGAKNIFANNPRIVFPRRIVTRKADVATEDHDTLTEMGFALAVAKGEFCLWWSAHGNSYGIPAAIEDDIAEGRTVVFNCSREVVSEACSRFLKATVVEVTAPRDILVQRILARGRESEASAIERASRHVEPLPSNLPVVRIENTGPLGMAVAALCRVIEPKLAPQQKMQRHELATPH
jgi:ribose 1,5-bisphosphokinase